MDPSLQLLIDRLHDDALRTRIVKHVADLVGEDDARDIMQSLWLKLREKQPRTLPATGDERDAFLLVASRRAAINLMVKAGRFVPEEHAPETAVEHPYTDPEPADEEEDAKQKVARLRAEASAVPAFKKSLDILEKALAEQKTQVAAAEEAGVSPVAHRKTVSRMNRKLYGLVMVSAMAIAAAGSGGLYVVKWIHAPVNTRGMTPDDSRVVRGPEQPPVEVAEARTMRDEARRAFAAGGWSDCLERLDAAKRIDPDGDAAPEVQAMRRDAQARALEEEKKRDEQMLKLERKLDPNRK